MANTSILIRRSQSTDRPANLAAGEFAYSYSSNTLFLGSPDGTGVLNVGGIHYTQAIDSATNEAVNNSLVKRSANGSASFSTIYGHLGTPSGVSAGTYGTTTAIPVITVGANGLITGISTSSISTTLNIAGDTGTDGISLIFDTLTFKGGDGITTNAVNANNAVVFDVDNTVIRTTGDQTITGNVAIAGNLIVSGNTITVNSESLNVVDPLIYLAANNYASDLVDIGFVGNYFDGTVQKHTGFFRKHASNTFYAFTGYTGEPSTIVDINDPSFVRASINANLVGGYVAGLANTISVVDGGTGASSFVNGGIVVGAGTGGLGTLANTTFVATGAGASNNTITSVTVDDYGRFTAATYSAISGLTVGQGGTGKNTFTSGAILIGDGADSLKELANTTFVATGAGASNNTITSVTVDSYGRFTAATYSAISGLTVGQGGTGVSSFTTNGIVFGNNADGLQVTAAAGTADQTWSNQILTTTNAGVPVWTTALDGGTF